MQRRRLLRGWPTAAQLLLASAVCPSLAAAQTWADQRSTPALRELASIDRTGEPNWLFGAEDVAGDGLNAFREAEQAADVRSAYLTTDRRRLWVRVYVSSPAAPLALAVFAFIDVDRDPATGGSANAPEVAPVLSTGAATSGYDLVLEMRPEPAQARIFRFSEANDEFEPIDDLEPFDLVAEHGTDLDPLRLVALENGYLQLTLDLAPLGLRAACDADFLFRSSGGMGLSDLDVGAAGPCLARDDNDNGLADVAETDAVCTTDEQCPADGACQDGQCRAPDVVVGPGELVQGGALSCDLSLPGSRRPGAWLLLGLVFTPVIRRVRAGVRRRRCTPS